MLVYLTASIISVIFANFAWRKRMLSSDVLLVTENSFVQKSHGKQRIFAKRIKATYPSLFLTFLSFLPLYLVSAFRYMVGTDYGGTYKTLYGYVLADGWHFRLTTEILYGLLNRVAIFYSGADFVGVFPLASLLTCGFIFGGLRKQSANLSYSILLFIISGFYFWSFNAVRQMIVMAIFIYAIQFITNKQPIKYVALILCASGFHTTGLLYLPIYFIKKIRMNSKVLIVVATVCMLFPRVFREIAYTLVSRIQVFNIYAVRYLVNPRFDSYTESSWAHTFINLSFFLLFIVINNNTQKSKQTKEQANMWLNFQFLALVFASFSGVLPLANRISRLFSVTQLLSVPFMTKQISDIHIRAFVNWGIVLGYTIYCIVTFYVLEYHGVFPYQTIFSR